MTNPVPDAERFERMAMYYVVGSVESYYTPTPNERHQVRVLMELFAQVDAEAVERCARIVDNGQRLPHGKYSKVCVGQSRCRAALARIAASIRSTIARKSTEGERGEG